MNIKRLLALILSMGLLMSNVTFGSETSMYGVTTSEDDFSAILPPTQKQSKGSMVSPRGSIISMGQAIISNDGGGRIGVYIRTSCHVSVDRIFMRLYLDSWNEKNQEWDNEGSYEFEYLRENQPNGQLYGATANFQIAGMPTNKYYRLRCAHVASNADSFEGLASQTDGVLITR